ncbi:MAG TPA: putative Ig domain-containing protein, partial [Gemmataceae bacterium]|nr:putative Ig domain-containing protein [Gemmataceae bacterium]
MFRALYQRLFRQRRPRFRTVRRRWPGYRSLPLRLEVLEPRILLDADIQCFLEGVYNDLLHRPLDSQSLAGWAPMLQQGVSRQAVVSQIENSTEYRTDLINQLCNTYWHRPPDPVALGTYLGYLQGGGTVEGIEISLLSSPEFFQSQGGGNDAGFLHALFEDVLGRPVDPLSQTVFGSLLQLGMPTADVALCVVASPEADAHVVETCYETYMHRPADPIGLVTWTSWMLLGAGEENLVAGMLGTQDYFDLADQECDLEEAQPAPPHTPAPPPVPSPPFCGFDPGLTGWTVSQTGGSATGHGTVTVQNSDAVLREGDSLTTSLQKTFTIPTTPSVLQFSYDNLSFDTTAHNQIKDSFEASFVDAQGNALVQTIGMGKDSFFNFTEGAAPSLAAGVTEAATDEGQTVSLDLAGLAPGTTGTLVLRLVNNDSDTNTSIHITCVEVNAAAGEKAVIATPALAGSIPQQQINFATLADVTPSATADYGQTSFNSDRTQLYTNLSVTNSGNYAMRAPLLAAITQLSDPTVRVSNPDGVLPDGTPYFDLSSLVPGGLLESGKTTGSRPVTFLDPNRTPFTYEVKVLSELNQLPAFTSQPNTEGIPGVPYVYQATAADPDGDPLTFSVVSGPKGLTIDPTTGKVTYNPQASDLGNHSVTLRVDDGLGGSAEQTYTLGVIQAPPNRPPVITSTPVVDANVNTSYTYQVTATDPDGTKPADPTGETLTFSVVAGPKGLAIDPASGLVTWRPTADQLGTSQVSLQVSDGRGGTATQTYSIGVLQQKGNDPPLIISTPVTTLAVGQNYQYPVKAVDADNDPLTYSLPVGPTGMTIDPTSGLITWNGPGPGGDTAGPAPVDGLTLTKAGAGDGFSLSDFVHGFKFSSAGPLGIVFPDALGGEQALISDYLGNLRLFSTDSDGQTTASGQLLANYGAANAFGLAQLKGKLYATQQSKGDVVQLNSDGSIAATIAQIPHATGIVADPINGHLYVSGQSGSAFLDTVFDIDPVADTVTPFFTKLARPDGLALSADGKTLYVALGASNQVAGFDIASGQQVFTSGTIYGIDGTAVGFGTLSSFIFANTNFGDVWEIPLNNLTKPVLIASGGSRGDFISTDPNDGSLLLTQSDEIVRLTPPTGGSFAQDFKVTVRVDDGRGAFDTQGYTLHVGDQPGEIEGTKFNDLNGNGSRDLQGASATSAPLINVSGTSDPYLAGQPDGATADGGDVAPAESPVLVSGVTLTPGASLMFTVLAGQVNNVPGGGGPGPDGGGFTGHWAGAQNGISNIVAPGNSLLGIFLGPNAPAGPTVPATLDFSSSGNVPGGVDYTTLSPQLNQLFFIGDGRTSGGQVQQVVVPAGATRLYLATMDGTQWNNNSGSFAVAVAPFDPTNGPQPITLTPISTNFNNVIHVDYYEPDNTLIASVNYGGGQPHNFEEIKADGSHVQFSNVSGFTDEVYMAIARSSDIGGFKPGDIFVGNGKDGQIARITDNGQTVINPWVTLPGSGHGLFRGYLTFDRTGVFSGDLIAETDRGEVWRINAAGQATEIANTHSFLEGVEVIPNDPARYGPLAGTILATNEQSSGFYSITPDGKVTFYDVGIGGLEDAHVIAANENFFGSDYGSGRILGIGANELTPLVGDILFTQESNHLFRMYWDGKAVQVQQLDYAPGSTTARQWEGSNLAPAGVAPLPPVPLEPGLPNWTIYLDLNHDGKLDPGDPTAVTDSLGHYSFTNLAPGTYTVAEVGQPGWRQTDPTGGEHTVTVLPGQVVSGVDFGNTQLNVQSGVRNPTFTTTAPTTATVGQLYRYDAAVTNPDGTSLTFDLPAHPAGMGVDPTTGVVFWEPTADEVGQLTVVLRVQDGNGRVALQSFQVTVSPAGSAPVITSVPPEQAVVGVTYQYRVKAQDAAGNPLTYTLDAGPAGMSIDPTGLLTYTATATQLGTQHVHLTVDNGHGGQAVQEFDLNVVATAPNDPPVISSAPRTVVRLGSDYLYAVQASDLDGDALSYSLATAPAGMTIDTNGVIRWTPTASQFGPNAVSVLVTDARGLAAPAQNFTVNVISQTVNDPPTITSTPPRAATLGHSFQYNATASDPDGDPVVWSLLKAPVGMSIDATTGTVRWTPTADELGPQDVEIQAQDPLLATATQSFTLQVRSVNVPPVIVSAPPTTAVTRMTYTYAVQATDAENDPLTYSRPAGPAGMTIDSSGVIHWTPTAAEVGTQTVLVQVDDGQGGTATQAYQVEVTDQAGNQAPAITSAAPLAATVGGNYKYAVAATDPDGDKVSFALISAPAGMTIDTTTGLVQWTPTAAELGANLVTIQAADPAGAQGEQTFAITVNANQPPQITSTAPATVTAGLTYRYDVHANDPDGDPLTYALTTGPAGMTLDPSSGRLTWSPGINDIGSHHVIIT